MLRGWALWIWLIFQRRALRRRCFCRFWWLVLNDCGCPLTFPRLSYGNPEPSLKRGNALRRQWNVQPVA